MTGLPHDLRYSLRQIRKKPGFSMVVVLTLALGIGANTAIFSLIDAIMLKSLPVKDPEQLVLLNWASPAWPSVIKSASGAPGDLHQDKAGRVTGIMFSYPTFKEFQASRDFFSGVFAFESGEGVSLKADGQAELGEGELASGDYFPTLGLRAAVGRLLTDSDDRPESPPTAVISYGYWEHRFQKTPAILGKALTINGAPFTIIGVAPPEFFGLRPGTAVDVWIPLSTQPLVESFWAGRGSSKFVQRDYWWLTIMGRIQPGVSRQRALAQLDVLLKKSAAPPQGASQSKPPTQSDFPTLGFVSGGKGLQSLREEFSKPLLILMVVVALVLFIACANVANLLLSRAASRHKEIAIRVAVGAARRRLIRQLLTESTLLAVIGGVLGLLLAYWATHLLLVLIASGTERITVTASPDLFVLGFTTAISLFTGVIFGLAPALQGTRFDLTSALKENSKGSASPPRRGRIDMGKALVISQIAVSLSLLVGAALFVRTLVNLENLNVGFDCRNILLFDVKPWQEGYKGERLAGFYQDLQRRIEALPGVRSATFSTLSLVGMESRIFNVNLEGQPEEPSGPFTGVSENDVGPHFFQTMGIPVMLGRPIGQEDITGQRKVAVVNEAFARKYFGGVNPIGHRFGVGIGSEHTLPNTEIVGVVANTKYEDLRKEIPPTVFFPQPRDSSQVTFEVRVAADPRDVIPAVRQTVQNLDPNLPLANVRTQVEQIEQTVFQERLFAKLSSFFGLLALILACVGLYGSMSYFVSRRTNEIGLRMALGARRGDVLRMILRQGGKLAGFGVGIGLSLSLLLTRYLASALYGVKATDPATFVLAAVLLCLVALLASYIPARRAAKVDPMVALRYE